MKQVDYTYEDYMLVAQCTGMDIFWNEDYNLFAVKPKDTVSFWRPLEDDGDCSRLEGYFKLHPVWKGHIVGCASPGHHTCWEYLDDHDGDYQRARRYAVFHQSLLIAREQEEKLKRGAT